MVRHIGSHQTHLAVLYVRYATVRFGCCWQCGNSIACQKSRADGDMFCAVYSIMSTSIQVRRCDLVKGCMYEKAAETHLSSLCQDHEGTCLPPAAGVPGKSAVV
jgi:hypothetical protein